MQKPTIAIMYDFDKTLSTKDMQEYTFIPKLGMSAEAFWQKSNTLARKQGMDSILAYMKLMLDESRRHEQSIRRSDFVSLGKSLEFFPGVLLWFDEVNNLGVKLGLDIEHFIISSGLREIIEGSAIGKQFKRIYACEYFYDENGVATWPKLSVNYTAKTQFLFRINKGVLDVYDDQALNAYKAESERSVPFRNMVYIGDGLTDVPCMKLVKQNGGKSIAVYAKGREAISYRLMKEDRINFFTEADYTSGGELFSLVKTILIQMQAENTLAERQRAMKRLAGL
ncbi:haloacid dehalogenase-like hydrolase [Sphaerochaeta halotolerans]|uniref:haloacid dehalogenase-like hydrolase n=1 Tax=Sphaerochaeta halotolerans TaxID=2293840 RepID=UPI0013699F58|nr:haloacid dehalogenase-like hydrolase [Sphaerochaeta halotolerans]MXI87690.1 haloacid dehalogenase-like hydrolase [Sphaerochaeta halotolerans]